MNLQEAERNQPAAYDHVEYAPPVEFTHVKAEDAERRYKNKCTWEAMMAIAYDAKNLCGCDECQDYKCWDEEEGYHDVDGYVCFDWDRQIDEERSFFLCTRRLEMMEYKKGCGCDECKEHLKKAFVTAKCVEGRMEYRRPRQWDLNKVFIVCQRLAQAETHAEDQ